MGYSEGGHLWDVTLLGHLIDGMSCPGGLRIDGDDFGADALHDTLDRWDAYLSGTQLWDAVKVPVYGPLSTQLFYY